MVLLRYNASPSQLHASLLKSNLLSDTHFSTILLSRYSNSLLFSEASLLLSSLPNPNLFSFSTLIHSSSKLSLSSLSLSLFARLLARKISPDRFLFPSLVKACSNSLSNGKRVHSFALVFGFANDAFVQSSLVHFYLKCGRIGDARKVFDGMSERDLVCWSAMIAGYSRFGFFGEALRVFEAMRKTGLEANTVTWNGMISGFNRSGLCSEAIGLFREMHLEGFSPDCCSVSSVLPAAGDLGALRVGIQVHCYALKRGYVFEKIVVSALIDMYGKCSCEAEMKRVFYGTDSIDVGTLNAFVTGLSRNGFVDDALEVFEKFKGREGMGLNTVSWTSVIASCSQNGRDLEALELFREMQVKGVKANSVTIPSVLPACGNVAALMHGKSAHCFALRTGIFEDVYVGSALVDMYANCGKIQLSRRCFDRIPNKNLVCWNAIMSGHAMHGKANGAIELFRMMQRSGLKPDFISFTCVLSACSQNGLTDEGWVYFNSMLNEYNIEPRLEHYGCMVTLLGRVGKLREAYDMIKKMPMEPDGSVWGSLLSSCRVHNDASLGEVAAKELFKLEPRNPGNYVMLSNIYASKGMWNDVDRVRDMMSRMGVRKNPGFSWIEVKNQMHMLLAGDKSHPQRIRITEKLNELSVEMRKSGYFPNTEFVLQDVEEHEKEHILCGHSEKLAVAFGLLNTPSGSSLTVIKNLRICGDCHAFVKFVSRLEKREIFVRDTNRFHHFKDGDCSCGDYW